LRDYSLDNKSQGRQSLSSQKHGPESDTDSMAEYGDGETGKKGIVKRNFLKMKNTLFDGLTFPI
jgi:hypothetical protein